MTAPLAFPGFPYRSCWVEVLGSRLHYLDEGSGAETLLFLHGNPTYSYVWRNVLPHVVPHARCVVLDAIGMGLSDKPQIAYRMADHIRFLEAFIEHLGLRDLTMVLHDTGSVMGFDYASRHPQAIRRLAFFEAVVKPIPSWDVFPAQLQRTFKRFRSEGTGWDLIGEQNMFIEEVLPAGMFRRLDAVEMDQYRRPYPDPASRRAVWAFPQQIPIGSRPPEVVAMVRRYGAWLATTPIPKLMFHARPGALCGPAVVRWCQQKLSRLTTLDLGRGLHYLQEDHAAEIGEALVRFCSSHEDFSQSFGGAA